MDFDSSISWERVWGKDPELADRIFAEYKRVGGFIPYEQGHVYAVQAVGTNYFKIGKSINPDKRILQIAPKMPFPTRIAKIWKSNFMSIAERWMHKDFQIFRANGEWFELHFDVQYHLFYSCVDYYTEEIMNAYSYTFLDSICKSPSDLEFVRDSISGSSLGMASLRSRDVMHWINLLFTGLDEFTTSIPRDLSDLFVQESEAIEARYQKICQR